MIACHPSRRKETASKTALAGWLNKGKKKSHLKKEARERILASSCFSLSLFKTSLIPRLPQPLRLRAEFRNPPTLTVLS